MKQQICFAAERWKMKIFDKNKTVGHRIFERMTDQLFRGVFKASKNFISETMLVILQLEKKQIVTRAKIKSKNICYTRKNLCSKYRYQNVKTKIGFSLFYRLKPFFFVLQTEKDRDTCWWRDKLLWLRNEIVRKKLMQNL